MTGETGLERPIQVFLFNVRKGFEKPTAAMAVGGFRIGPLGPRAFANRHVATHRKVIHYARAELLKAIRALGSGCGFANLLDSGQQESNQDSNDCDHHEEFNKGKRRPSTGMDGHSPFSMVGEGIKWFECE